ncbi:MULTISPECIES: tetratricopeptide repeat protein [unclassified Streptomyces]|uniref:tetratricopeptide repeat protein n=1 Tax=unclassified Streptomyces TaxID=2593676 RepID=UPI0021562933|nr:MULTISPECIES: tetratricopeptide repeat protein [unclassified Streptomyces]
MLTQVLAGGGGYGKSQLAASYARDAVAEGTQLVVWTPATDEQAVVTTYARAATAVRAPGATGDDPVADAQAFLSWLATTDRSWLVVLDNVTDPGAVQKWWPQGRAGWVLATTRLQGDARLTAAGRTRVTVDVYTRDEAHAYLRQRLSDAHCEHLYDQGDAGAVVEELGLLPLALGFAAAHMIQEDITCAEYVRHLTDQHLPDLLPAGADAEDYGRPVAAALLLNLAAAIAAGPSDIVEPALHLAALLDPDGHPLDLWATESVLGHLGTYRSEIDNDDEVVEVDVRRALTVLHRYGLITRVPNDGPRAVRVHALTARAVRENTPTHHLPALATAAADALHTVWPRIDQPHRELASALRANTDTLHSHTGRHLWRHQHGAHPLLFRAGRSLQGAGLHVLTTAYWKHIQQISERLLGADHPDTLTTRSNLASSYSDAGRTQEAIELQEWVLADEERLLGADHPDTLTTRSNLASSYSDAGRTQEAIELKERVLAERERVLGTDHPDTLTTRTNLAISYRDAGRAREALELGERVLAERERVLGTDHPDTLTTRSNLAVSYDDAGRTEEAIELKERVLAERERVLGTDHPDTLTTRSNLALSYRDAGRAREALELGERVLAERERVLGTDHPDTLTTRSNVALSYDDAGRTEEAIELQERVLADRERLQGADHPGTLLARGNLASFYGDAGRTEEAIELQERVLADRERLQGTDHPGTLLARGNLAASYWSTGRTPEAVDLQEQVLADQERLQGPDHPDTIVARGNLAVSYWDVNRAGEAIAELERALADRERVLGADHPHAYNARARLDQWLAQE